MRRNVFLAVAAMALGAMVAPMAEAQLSTQGGPIAYSADSLEYFDAERRLVLSGNVEIAQNDATLRGATVTLFFSAAAAAPQAQATAFGAGDIQRMEAVGNVFYVRPDQTARGDRAVYETKADTVTFYGNVVVASAENVIRGETLVLQISGGRTSVKPGAAPGQRVRGVFRSQQQQQPRRR
jgi:lipopolysaccharide export system protein LptA